MNKNIEINPDNSSYYIVDDMIIDYKSSDWDAYTAIRRSIKDFLLQIGIEDFLGITQESDMRKLEAILYL